MNILVTGADGYIGSLLAPLLIERGHEVVGLDTGFYRNGWLYNGVKRAPLSVTKDIRDVTVSDVSEFDAVVDLAGLSNDSLGQLNPKITHQINYEATVNLAWTCRQVGITRFVYPSSCSVYGVGSDEYQTEESEPNPQTAYAECKVLVERRLSTMADDNFSPTFLRNATAYGPSPRMRFDLVVNNLAGLAWTSQEINMTSDGTPWRPLVHVLDICEAIVCSLAADREVVHNQIFNVGNTKENYQIRDIANIISDVFPGCTLSLGQSSGDNRTYRVSFEKINKYLPDFTCQRNVVTGTQELRDLFEKTCMTKEIFEFPAYTRLKQIEYLLKTNQINNELFWR